MFITRIRMKRYWSYSAVLLSVIVLSACGDDDGGPSGPRGQEAFDRYVSIGTSVTMGVQSDGVFYASQQHAWPALLAHQAFASHRFTTPLIQGPGCYSPLIAPIQFTRRLSGAQYPSVNAQDQVCALYPNITLPTNNVAVDGATTYHALRITPESTTNTPLNVDSDQRKRLYRAVMAPRMSQITSMMAQNPTLVSVELGANEALRTATSGVLLPAAGYRQGDETFTYYPTTVWRPQYDAVVDSVAKTGAKALLVSVPLIPNLVGMYPGDDFWQDRAAFQSFGIIVNADCSGSQNQIFAPGKVLFALSRPKPFDFSCTNNPAATPTFTTSSGPDYVLTESDTTFVNGLIRSMNAHIQAQASSHGWAYLDLNTSLASFVTLKPRFSVARFLSCTRPFGQFITLDGIHPSVDGQQAIANAAADALNAHYDFAIPTNTLTVLTPAQICP
jgi:lysophospholipase L1-like esterase